MSTISVDQLKAIWFLYFPDEEFIVDDSKILIIKAFTQFFSTNGSELLSGDPFSNISVPIDFTRLVSICPLKDLSLAIIDHPEDTIRCMSASLSLIYHMLHKDHDPVKFYFEIVNMKPLLPIKLIKSNCIGKFAMIRGTVIRCTKIHPYVVAMQFMCSKCQTYVKVFFKDAQFEYPRSCQNNCKFSSFIPQYDTATTQDCQLIRVQETDIMESEEGSIPKTVNCYLYDQLIDRCVPGDNIELAGIVKMRKIDSSKLSGVHILYLHANSIRSSKNLKTDELDSVEFNARDMLAIQEIVKEPDVFALLVQSLCPSIFGMDVIKSGLLLSLLGGSEAAFHRDTIHTLIVGDPGLGKSQLLRSISNLSSRGVYVCGNTTTKTGLTVSIVKDSEEGTGFEAGALVLADRGVCCVDELDKMKTEQESLLEAMEQQIVSVAKSGILCSLPARTTVIAASNPCDGHYNQAKTVEENIQMSSALLSRFDIIFLLIDDVNLHRDEMLAKHIINLHKSQGHSLSQRFSSSLIEVPDLTFEERMRIRCSKIVDPLPTLLLRKYILYARKYIQPELSPESCNLIQEYYLQRRQFPQTTSRFIFSLIRLSQARAKINLEKIVTVAHVNDVISILDYSFKRDELEDISFVDFGQSRKKMTKPKQIQLLLSILKKDSQEKQSPLFSIHEIKELAGNKRLPIDDLDDIIYLCNDQGYLLQKGPKLFQLSL